MRADEEPDHCTEFHADDESWWEDVYYWDTPTADCGGEGGEACVTQEDWRTPGRRSGWLAERSGPST